MKKSILPLTILSFSYLFAINVTFQVNMQYTDPSQGVYIRGGNIGSSLPDTPSMGFQMSDDNSDLVYDVTLELEANSHYTYKFATGESWGWEGNWENVPAECGEGEYIDRFLDTGEEDTTLGPICFGSCEDCVDETINVTFNLDMSDVETSSDGVFVGGGGTFGVPGDNPMSDDDGDDVWTATFELPAGLSTDYTFLNGNCGDWSCKENIAGQDCAVPPYSDRHIDLGTEDVTVNACFAVCGDGSCSDLTLPETVNVTFQVNMNGYDWGTYDPTTSLHATGNYEGWTGAGTLLSDSDADGIYSAVVEIIENTTGVEYKYVIGGWGGPESGAELGSDCDYNPSDEYNNYGFDVATDDIVLPAYIFGGGCSVSEEPPSPVQVTFQVDMSHNPEVLDGHTIALQGEFAGWWPGIVMTDDDGDSVFTATVELDAGSYEYKFAGYEWSTTEFPDWSYTEDNAPSCLILNECTGENGECQFINRSVAVGSSDATLSPVCWASCQTCSFDPSTALVNGDFDGDDSAWTPWIVGEPVEIDLSYTDDGPTGGSGEALRVVASDYGNGGVYQAVNLEEDNVYELSGLFKGVGCDQNWLEISILDDEPQQGVDVGSADVIVKQHFWDCGSSAPWEWDTDFANACGGNPSMIGAPPGVFQASATGVYYILIKSGGVASDVMFDNLILGPSDYIPTEGVSVTFNLDMSSVPTSEQGAYLAGGGTFGNPGDNPMSDDDGDDIWTITVQLDTNFATDYTFTNGFCGDWGCKEDLTGQDCAVPPYNDRHLETGEQSMVINACFGFCGDGFCSNIETDCSDGIDNDEDGDIDCDDSNCANDVACLDDFSGITNPGFEEDTDEDGVPDGWFCENGSASSPATIGSGDAHTGEQYLVLNVGGTGWAVAYQQNIPVNVGETWTFSSWIKDVTPGGAGGDFAALKLEFYDEFNTSLIPGGVETIQQGVSDDWNLFSATYPLPENTVRMTVVLVATRWDNGGDANYGFDDVEFTCEGCETGGVTIDHSEGWNMVGLPLEVESSAYGDLFPSSVAGTLYGFTGTYTPESELTPGAGYWLVFSDTGSDELMGDAINSLTLELSQGWNMISGVTLPVDISAVDDPESIIVPGTLYGFSGTYQNSSTLVPGQGYWINASGGGEVHVSAGGAARASFYSFTDLTKKANILSFNEGNLYFGISIPDEEMLSYQLPPKPPTGMFDVRFVGDRKMVETSGAIEIMNNTQDLSISYSVSINAGNNMRWILVSSEGNEYELKGSGNIVVDGDINHFTLNKVSSIPTEFSLSQNFPNPFNPTTSISYSLPENSDLSINIYSLTGQKIIELVEGHVKAGIHTVTWNGMNHVGVPVSSGVYIYMLQSDSFTALKKMILIK